MDTFMDECAKSIVADYVRELLGREDDEPCFRVFIIHRDKILQNYEYVLSDDIHDRRYELTYNGCEEEWTLCVYDIVSTKVVKWSTVGCGQIGD